MPALLSPHPVPEDLSGALRTVLNIFKVWRVTSAEATALLGCSPATYFRWQRSGSLGREPDRNTLERLSYLLGIWKALQILYTQQGAADTWVRRPNRDPLFAGRAPMQLMTGGLVADLYRVRSFLDGWRG